MEYQTNAIILAIYDRGEDSRSFSILSPDFGKLQVVGQGTKKIKSKLNGHMQFFSIVHVGIARGKRNNQLINAMLNKRYNAIASSYEKRIMALAGCELMHQLLDESEEAAPLYESLVVFFGTLDDMRFLADKARLLYARFSYHVLEQLGYAPDQQYKNDFNHMLIHCQSILDKPLHSVELLQSVVAS